MKKLSDRFIIFFLLLLILSSFPSEGSDLFGKEEEMLGNSLDFLATEAFVMIQEEALRKRISGITNKLVRVSALPDVSLRVRIINDKAPNVSSFPGFIYLSTGMLDILKNEGELASVIAHAVGHIHEKDPLKRYEILWKMEKWAIVTSALMPLMVFGGAAVAGATGMAALLSVESGVYVASASYQALTTQDLPEKRIFLNRLGPLLTAPDRESRLSALIVLSDVYAGYEKKKEMRADELAMEYLGKAGYDRDSFVSVLKKLLKLRDDYLAQGHVSHVLIAEPGLEKRIEHATQIINNYR
ncbi:hypothetical protein EP227_03940 [bacterium]|nr:MAG: hypothetical protein EP227_03940 [bacterium]